MADVVVTVPKNFTHPAAPGKRGLAAWLAEGDAPGEPESGTNWIFSTWGFKPNIERGERVYVVCEGRLVGYAPLVELYAGDDYGEIEFLRRGGAVACTIAAPITGFRGWRYRWWDRNEEIPLQLEASHART